MSKTGDHRLELVGLELLALAQLLERWAQPNVVKKRSEEWERKLGGFRAGVIAGRRRGITRWIAPEIVQGEYRLACDTLRLLRTEWGNARIGEVVAHLASSPISYPGTIPRDKAFVLRRPAPVPTSCFAAVERNIRSEKRSPEPLARRIVAARLDLSPATVKRVCEAKSRIAHRPAHDHLASLFLDTVSFCENSAPPPRVSGILDSLLFSGYHVVALFYLTRCAHRLPSNIAAAPCQPRMLARYCRAVAPNYQAGPFGRLFRGRK